MEFSIEIRAILEDRESGSVGLLNRLLTALEKELRRPDLEAIQFIRMLTEIRKALGHFAAIENFLEALLLRCGKKDAPDKALEYISQYRVYWRLSAGRIAGNFLRHLDPEGHTLLTHSHSQTILSLLEELKARGTRFRVLQTLSSPGEEGRIAHERMLHMGMDAELIDDAAIPKALVRTGLVIMGCDALFQDQFLNKTGTGAILAQARSRKIPAVLVSESRKYITRPDWKAGLAPGVLFEWVDLDMVERVVTEI